MVDHYKDLFLKAFNCPIDNYTKKLFKPKLDIPDCINNFMTNTGFKGPLRVQKMCNF